MIGRLTVSSRMQTSGAGSSGDGSRLVAPLERGSLIAMEFSPELRERVKAGEITVTFRRWQRAMVRLGGTYPVLDAQIQVDAIELMPFAAISRADLRRAGEADRESLRKRAAHSGPIGDDTTLFRIEFHVVIARQTGRASTRTSSLCVPRDTECG